MKLRRGLGRGKGMGYKNLVPQDKPIHSESAKGIKQPQIKYVPPVMMKPTVRKNNFEAPIRNPYFENWSDEQLMREWRRTPRGLSQYGSDRYQALLREIVERKKRKDAEKVVGKKWDGSMDSGSEWARLRQKGYSHDEAVAIIEGRAVGGLGDNGEPTGRDPDGTIDNAGLDEDEPREMTDDDAVRMFDTQREYLNAISRAEETEKVVGGLGDNRPDSDFNKKELAKGIKVEMEHTKDPKIAKEIVKDHLTEFPKGYYEELDKMETKLKKMNVSPLRQIGEIYLSKESRDKRFAELQSRYGKLYRKTSVRNQQLHPQYIKDYKGSVESGFGNTQYKSYYPVLYKIDMDYDHYEGEQE